MSKLAVLAAGIAGALILANTASAQVSISYYSSYSDTGSGIEMTGSPFATGVAPTIQLGDLQPDPAINAAANWPGAGMSFGAIINETVDAASAGQYTFNLESDDGSYLFVNGGSTPAISNGGAHSEATASGSVQLVQGLNQLQVQYDNIYCCGAGVQLFLPSGVTVSDVPEPATWALMMLGIGGIGFAFRQAKRNHGFRFKDAFAA